jgi:hypothetical protein
MAGIQKCCGSYRVIYRYHSKQHTLPLGKVSYNEAKKQNPPRLITC